MVTSPQIKNDLLQMTLPSAGLLSQNYTDFFAAVDRVTLIDLLTQRLFQNKPATLSNMGANYLDNNNLLISYLNGFW